MFFFKQQSPSAQAALAYVTAGALLVVWTIIWSIYLLNSAPESKGIYYLYAGSLMTGLVLLTIGLGVGHIGRSASKADNTVEAHPDVVAPNTQEAAPVYTGLPTKGAGNAALEVAGVRTPNGPTATSVRVNDPAPELYQGT